MSSRYANAVYGNLAYGSGAANAPSRELGRPARVFEPENETIYEELEVRVKQKAKTASKQSISAFAVLGCICIAGLFFLILLSYIKLNAISDNAVKLSSDLETLKTAETRLQLDYESAFDLKEIENYAINTLGMDKPGENQVYYIQRKTNDQAVVLKTEEKDTGVFKSITTFLSTIAGNPK